MPAAARLRQQLAARPPAELSVSNLLIDSPEGTTKPARCVRAPMTRYGKETGSLARALPAAHSDTINKNVSRHDIMV
jgi:hypothetical protein